MPRELIFAEDTAVAVIVTEGIAPVLKQLETELHATLRVSVHQWAAGEERAWGFCGPTQADHEGVARIFCSPNYGGRLTVGAHVVFDPDVARGRGTPDFLSTAAYRRQVRLPVCLQKLHCPVQSVEASDAVLRGAHRHGARRTSRVAKVG